MGTLTVHVINVKILPYARMKTTVYLICFSWSLIVDRLVTLIVVLRTLNMWQLYIAVRSLDWIKSCCWKIQSSWFVWTSGAGLKKFRNISIRKIQINLGSCKKFSVLFSLTQAQTGYLLQISRDRDDRMGAKIKTQKNPLGFKQNAKKSLHVPGPKFIPQKIPCRISEL